MNSHSQTTNQATKTSRSTNGCICCRLRRKKCGEEKPFCAGCQRNGLLCTWPDIDNVKHAALLRRTNRTQSSPHNVSVDGSKRMRRSSKSPEESTVPKASSGTTPSPSQFLAMDKAYQNLRSAFGTLEIFNVVPRSLDPQALYTNALLSQPTSRQFFDHYLHHTHKIMAMCQGNENPFIKEVLPMAVANRVILNALLAFSGIHYADARGIPVDQMTWEHYGQAVHGQKLGLTLLSQGKQEAIVPLLVTATILGILESFRVGAGSAAVQHLKAVSFLLPAALKLPTSMLSVATRRFLTERYLYTLILAHITMGPESDSWVLEDAELLLRGMESNSPQQPGLVFGCVHELFQFIPSISILVRKRQAEDHAGICSAEIAAGYTKLYAKVSLWSSKSTDPMYTLCGILYQYALSIYLATAFQDDTKTKDLLHNFITFLQSIPIDSPLSTMLCWPLAIIGSCATLSTHREIIRQRLKLLSLTYAAQSVRDTCRLLEHIWINNEGASPLDFKQIMEQENMTVLFL